LTIQFLQSPARSRSRNGEGIGRVPSLRSTFAIGMNCLKESQNNNHRADSSRLARCALGRDDGSGNRPTISAVTPTDPGSEYLAPTGLKPYGPRHHFFY
jgi:hypothetical protein